MCESPQQDAVLGTECWVCFALEGFCDGDGLGVRFC